MSPDAIARLLKTIAVLVVLGALWWSWGKFTAWVREPVVAELEKATRANASLQDDLARERKLSESLAGTLAKRSAREAVLDRKLAGLQASLRAAKSKDPVVREWADTPIPPAVLEPAK